MARKLLKGIIAEIWHHREKENFLDPEFIPINDEQNEWDRSDDETEQEYLGDLLA